MSLLRLPTHLHAEIASLSDEQTVRSIRRCCRALRDGAEPAFLAKTRIVGQNPIVSAKNLFKPIEYLTKKRDDYELRMRYASFDTLLDTHPGIGSYVRDLAVEVDAGKLSAGWHLLKRLAPRLTHVSFHIITNPREADRDAETHRHDDNHRDGDIWDRLFVSPKDTPFPNVTTVSVAVTDGNAAYCARLLLFFPHLHDLTLIGYSQSVLLPRPSTPGVTGRYAELRRLTIIGSSAMVDAVAYEILHDSPNLEYFTVSALDHRLVPRCNAHYILQQVSFMPHLKGLALYGTAAMNFNLHTATLNSPAGQGAGFDHLKRLVLERAWDTAGNAATYHLLNADCSPTFPSLHHITWVYRAQVPAPRPNPLDLPRPRKRPPPAMYNSARTYDLFDRYPKLEQARCLAQYPADPFADTFPVDWATENVRCCVRRPAPGQLLKPHNPV